MLVVLLPVERVRSFRRGVKILAKISPLGRVKSNDCPIVVVFDPDRPYFPRITFMVFNETNTEVIQDILPISLVNIPPSCVNEALVPLPHNFRSIDSHLPVLLLSLYLMYSCVNEMRITVRVRHNSLRMFSDDFRLAYTIPVNNFQLPDDMQLEFSMLATLAFCEAVMNSIVVVLRSTRHLVTLAYGPLLLFFTLDRFTRVCFVLHLNNSVMQPKVAWTTEPPIG